MIKAKNIKVVIEFALLIIGLNYFSSKSQQIGEELIARDYMDKQTGNRQVFSSFAGLMFLQKATILIISFLSIHSYRTVSRVIIKYRKNKSMIPQSGQKIQIQNELYNSQLGQSGDNSPQLLTMNKKQVDQLESNCKENVSLQFQATLGLLFFLSQLLYSYIQRETNVIVLVVAKYSNLFFVFMSIFFFVPSPNTYFKLSANLKCCKKSHLNYFQIIKLATPLVASSVAIKLVNQIYPYYYNNLNVRIYHSKLWPILVLVVCLCIDNVFYVMIYRMRSKQPRINAIQLLFSITKFTALFFGIYVLFTGQLVYLMQFTQEHPSILPSFIKFSLLNFVKQVIIYSLLVKYEPYVFFSLIVSKGVFEKAFHYMFQRITYISFLYYIICITLIAYSIALTRQIQVYTQLSSGEYSYKDNFQMNENKMKINQEDNPDNQQQFKSIMSEF